MKQLALLPFLFGLWFGACIPMDCGFRGPEMSQHERDQRWALTGFAVSAIVLVFCSALPSINKHFDKC